MRRRSTPPVARVGCSCVIGRLGAEQLLDRSDDPDDPLYVFADPAGHPFCIFVA